MRIPEPVSNFVAGIIWLVVVLGGIGLVAIL